MDPASIGISDTIVQGSFQAEHAEADLRDFVEKQV
jgi:hypothetical protein